jgi:hypothetical protein
MPLIFALSEFAWRPDKILLVGGEGSWDTCWVGVETLRRVNRGEFDSRGAEEESPRGELSFRCEFLGVD